MKEKIKKYIGGFMLVIGSGIFAYNVFNFSYRAEITRYSPILAPEGGKPVGVAYYYSSDTLLLISIGIMLIVSGVLIIRNNRQENKNK